MKIDVSLMQVAACYGKAGPRRGALDGVGYNGWMTIEGSGGLSLEEKSKRLDLILAGK